MTRNHCSPSNTESIGSRVLVVPVSMNLGDLPYFDSLAPRDTGGADVTVRQVRFHGDHVVEGFPLLYCASRLPDALEMNLFMEHRYRGKFLRPKASRNRNPKGGVSLKTLKSIANSLRGFLAWLDRTDTDWREVYAAADGDRAKAWLPPYRYRVHLIGEIEAGKVSRDTASLYVNHVRQFYEWAHKMRRIDRIPFAYKRIAVRKPRKDGDFDLLFSAVQDEKALMVQTADLAIPKRYKSKMAELNEGLTPYTVEELKMLFDSDHMRLDSRKLWAELALACGLRAAEVAALSESAVVNPSLSSTTAFPVRVTGKFNKERMVLLPHFLMLGLWEYRNSAERMRRAAKWDLVHGADVGRPLFLNRSGKPINSASLTNVTSCVARKYAEGGIRFGRSFHDLRATFATSLARFMLEKHLPLGFIQYKLMSLMGHANFSTTQKYLNFARSITFESQMQDWVSQIFADLRPGLESEAIASMVDA
ncbi:site-specific integrase [Caballeronia sp. LZ025]|uniref:tyrosine-type recombinase/integrase n=1 Tax=Caballeronia TaxID=1827195 RepID=UPI001FD57CB5|nr:MULTISPECIES: site-specific integrase [Caballeronia]MDR5736035.1 site-specific integrase [Caballeronia sp. LZ025]MDR5883834.1 site-specific integrase [Caballeronia sp. LZ032]